jgi:hypothetical protein
MAGIREELQLTDIPKPFQGAGITLVTAGILAIAFMGFTGMDSGIRKAIMPDMGNSAAIQEYKSDKNIYGASTLAERPDLYRSNMDRGIRN